MKTKIYSVQLSFEECRSEYYFEVRAKDSNEAKRKAKAKFLAKFLNASARAIPVEDSYLPPKSRGPMLTDISS